MDSSKMFTSQAPSRRRETNYFKMLNRQFGEVEYNLSGSYAVRRKLWRTRRNEMYKQKLVRCDQDASIPSDQLSTATKPTPSPYIAEIRDDIMDFVDGCGSTSFTQTDLEFILQHDVSTQNVSDSLPDVRDISTPDLRITKDHTSGNESETTPVHMLDIGSPSSSQEQNILETIRPHNQPDLLEQAMVTLSANNQLDTTQSEQCLTKKRHKAVSKFQAYDIPMNLDFDLNKLFSTEKIRKMKTSNAGAERWLQFNVYMDRGSRDTIPSFKHMQVVDQSKCFLCGIQSNNSLQSNTCCCNVPFCNNCVQESAKHQKAYLTFDFYRRIVERPTTKLVSGRFAFCWLCRTFLKPTLKPFDYQPRNNDEIFYIKNQPPRSPITVPRVNDKNIFYDRASTQKTKLQDKLSEDKIHRSKRSSSKNEAISKWLSKIFNPTQTYTQKQVRFLQIYIPAFDEYTCTAVYPRRDFSYSPLNNV